MTAEMATLFSMSMAFIIAGVALKASAETGQMILLEHLKEDWTHRLPFHLRNNRYRGLSRPCYQLLAILYYLAKAVVIIALCGYYYILAGACVVIKRTWRKIRCSRSRKVMDMKQKYNDSFSGEVDDITENTGDVCVRESIISNLWNHGSEAVWHGALEHYYELLNAEAQELDRYMEDVDADEIAQLSVPDFYDFLYDKYFVWKYTQKNRLATTRKSLRKYVDENKLFELADIQKRLFLAEHSNIEKCLSIATEIRGLGPAGASGLLSILFPEDFGTVDQFVVKALREVEGFSYADELAKMNPDSLSIENGVVLIKILREQAKRLNMAFDTDFWTPRKIDMVLWSIGR